MTKKRMSDGCEFIFNSDGTVKDIKVPDHLKPDISLDDDWYKDMMNDIRDKLKAEFQTRQPPVILSAQVIDEIAQRVNKDRMKPASGNRKARLIKGRNWTIRDRLGDPKRTINSVSCVGPKTARQ